MYSESFYPFISLRCPLPCRNDLLHIEIRWHTFYIWHLYTAILHNPYLASPVFHNKETGLEFQRLLTHNLSSFPSKEIDLSLCQENSVKPWRSCYMHFCLQLMPHTSFQSDYPWPLRPMCASLFSIKMLIHKYVHFCQCFNSIVGNRTLILWLFISQVKVVFLFMVCWPWQEVSILFIIVIASWKEQVSV